MKYLFHPRSVTTLAYTPDGRTLFTGDGSPVVPAWNLATGEQSVVMQDVSRGAGCWEPLGVSPDGKKLAVWSVRLVLCEIGPIPATSDSLSLIAVNPHDRRFLLAPGWTLTYLPRIYGVMTISPDWKLIAHHYTSTIRLWGVEDATWQGNKLGRGCNIGPAEFSADSKRLAAVGWGRKSDVYRLFFWDVHTRRCRQRLISYRGPTLPTPHFSRDGRWLALRGKAAVDLYDADSGRMAPGGPIPIGGRRHINDVAFSPDGRQLLTANRDVIRLWDVEGRKLLEEWNWGIGRVNCIKVAPDGQTAAAAGSSRKVVIWDLE